MSERPLKRCPLCGAMLPNHSPGCAWIDPPEPPPPPTGPPADIPDHAANRYRHYVAWRVTREGMRTYSLIQARALTLLSEGERRVSVNALAEEVRRRKRKVNNTYRAWIADDLVREHPELLAVIERRERRKVKV